MAGYRQDEVESVYRGCGAAEHEVYHLRLRRSYAFGATICDAIRAVTGSEGIEGSRVWEFISGRLAGGRYFGNAGSSSDNNGWSQGWLFEELKRRLGEQWHYPGRSDRPLVRAVYVGWRGDYFVIRDVLRALPYAFRLWARAERRRYRRGVTPWQEELCRLKQREHELEGWAEVSEMVDQVKELVRRPSHKHSRRAGSARRESSGT